MLFQPTRDRNIVLNFRHAPETEFGVYATAFHEAGRTLLREVLSREGSFFDFEALPIVYLYRHALELAFKSIILAGDRFLEAPVSAQERAHILTTHRLVPLFRAACRVFEARGWGKQLDLPSIATIDDLRAVLEEFDKVDEASAGFRYPTDKKLQGSLPHHFMFDLRAFGEVLDPLLDLLESAEVALDEAEIEQELIGKMTEERGLS